MEPFSKTVVELFLHVILYPDFKITALNTLPGPSVSNLGERAIKFFEYIHFQ